jgi:hypothetical protein
MKKRERKVKNIDSRIVKSAKAEANILWRGKDGKICRSRTGFNTKGRIIRN